VEESQLSPGSESPSSFRQPKFNCIYFYFVTYFLWRVFENRVLRRIFGLKRDEVMGDWRKRHSEELHNLYSSPNIIRMIKSRRMRWAGHAARIEETTNACRILVGNPEVKRPLRRPRRRWVDNIKIDLREIEWDGMDWIDLVQDRDQWRALVNMVMNLWVP
jgi:GH43 family beta-xylosidase